MTNGGDGNGSTGTGRPAGCVADLREAVGHFSAAVDVMAGGWDLLDDDARHELYVELETARRRLAIVDTEYLSATANGRVVKQTPVAMRKLVENAHVSRAEARRRLTAAHRLQRAEAQDRPPKHDLPAVRQRVEEGVAGADAVELIHKALDELPERGNDSPLAGPAREKSASATSRPPPHPLTSGRDVSDMPSTVVAYRP